MENKENKYYIRALLTSALVCFIPGAVSFYFDATWFTLITVLALFAIWGILTVMENI